MLRVGEGGGGALAVWRLYGAGQWLRGRNGRVRLKWAGNGFNGHTVTHHRPDPAVCPPDCVSHAPRYQHALQPAVSEEEAVGGSRCTCCFISPLGVARALSPCCSTIDCVLSEPVRLCVFSPLPHNDLPTGMPG
jgi:hypothetical protein